MNLSTLQPRRRERNPLADLAKLLESEDPAPATVNGSAGDIDLSFPDAPPQQSRTRAQANPLADLQRRLEVAGENPLSDLAASLGPHTVEDKLRALTTLNSEEKQQHINRLHQNRVELAKLGNERDKLENPGFVSRYAEGLSEMVRHPLRTVTGIVTAPVESFATAIAPTHKEAAELNADPMFKARMLARFGRDVTVPGVSGTEKAAGIAQTMTNIVAPGLGLVRGGLLAGAANAPEDPFVGAAIGVTIGKTLKSAGEGVQGSRAANASEFQPAMDKAFGDLSRESRGTAPAGDLPSGFATERFAENLERGLPDAARTARAGVPRLEGLQDVSASFTRPGSRPGRVTGKVEGLEQYEPFETPRRTRPLADVEYAGDVVSADAAARQRVIDDAAARRAQVEAYRAQGYRRRPGGVKPADPFEDLAIASEKPNPLSDLAATLDEPTTSHSATISDVGGINDAPPPPAAPFEPIRSQPGDVPNVPFNSFGHPTEGMATMRKRVMSFAREHLIGNVFRNDQSGWEVAVSRDAIDHATFPRDTKNWHESALALRALPDLIRDAVRHSSEVTRGGPDAVRDVPMHHRLRAPFTIDGEPFTAELTLRELREGPYKLYHVKAINVEPDAPSRPGPIGTPPWGQPPTETPGSFPNDTPVPPNLSTQTGGALPSFPEGFAMGGPEGRIPNVPRQRTSRATESAPAELEGKAPIDREELTTELESLQRQRDMVAGDPHTARSLSDEQRAWRDQKLEQLNARIEEVQSTLENTVTRSARRSTIDLTDEPRYENGSRRPLHTITVKGLIRELLDLEEKRVDAGHRSQYAWASDENNYYMDDNRYFPVATRQGGKGVSTQAKAFQNLDDYARIETEVMRELEKARGLPPDVIHDLLTRAREAELERKGLASDARELDTSFDFGPGMADEIRRNPPDISPENAATIAEFPLLPTGERVPSRGSALNPNTWDQSPTIQSQLEPGVAGVEKIRVRTAEGMARVRQMTHATLVEMGMDPTTMDLRKVGRLSGEEIVAFKQAATHAMDQIAAISKRLEEAGLSPAEHGTLADQLEKTIEARDAILERVVHATSQKGRDLGFLRQIANRTLDPDVWVVQARRIAGDAPLSDATIAEIRRLARETAEACSL